MADNLIMADEYYWAYRRAMFKLRVGEYTNQEPIVLRNPYIGRIFWMQS